MTRPTGGRATYLAVLVVGLLGTGVAGASRENDSDDAPEHGGSAVTDSPWHRRVSPVFFILLVIAGLMLGGAVYVAVSRLLPT